MSFWSWSNLKYLKKNLHSNIVQAVSLKSKTAATSTTRENKLFLEFWMETKLMLWLQCIVCCYFNIFETKASRTHRNKERASEQTRESERGRYAIFFIRKVLFREFEPIWSKCLWMVVIVMSMFTVIYQAQLNLMWVIFGVFLHFWVFNIISLGLLLFYLNSKNFVYIFYVFKASRIRLDRDNRSSKPLLLLL